MDATISQTIERFSGINNSDELTRLSPVAIDNVYVYPLSQASNVEIDNTYGIKSRSGYDEIVAGTDIHSLWADTQICLFVDNASLKTLDEIYNTVTVRTGLSDRRMSYARNNDRVYYTNEEEIGYVIGVADYPLPDPDREFKLPLPAGQVIEYFKGCLYVAKDNILYISDPLCDYYDARIGYRIFTNRITMVKAVDDGLFVSDDHVWFVNGKGNEDFDRNEVYSSPAIPNTALSVNAKSVNDSFQGTAVIWTSENGICLGVNGGEISNLTESKYEFTPTSTGAAFIRKNGNVRHYINVLGG